jgi:hypothetical protein
VREDVTKGGDYASEHLAANGFVACIGASVVSPSSIIIEKV